MLRFFLGCSTSLEQLFNDGPVQQSLELPSKKLELILEKCSK